MATNRSIPLCIIFTLLTFGIYGIYWFIKLTDELNANSSIKTAGGGTALVFTLLTGGIYGYYWIYKQGQKIDDINSNLGGNTGIMYLVLHFFGLAIIAYCLMQSEINRIA